MYEVIFYRDKNGHSPLLEYLQSLTQKTDKNSRINVKKITDYIAYLEAHGPKAREPYAKHLGGDIWELRPIRNRILYASWNGKSFILLHMFQKDTQKTPKREIEQAQRNLTEFKERSKNND